LTIVAAATPGGNFSFGILAALFWLGSLCAWVALAITERFRDRLGILLPPLLAITTFMMVAFDLPIRSAFLISGSELARYADSIPEREKWFWNSRRIGMFDIEGARRWKGVTQIYTSGGGGIFTKCGLVLARGDGVPEVAGSTVDHVIGDWYVFCTKFD
jgi:hypothetical protein